MCDFLLVINSDLDLISHRLATIHLLQTTDDDVQTNNNSQHKPLHKYGRLKRLHFLFSRVEISDNDTDTVAVPRFHEMPYAKTRQSTEVI